MYYPMAERLALTVDVASLNSPYIETSPAVSMGVDNAVEFDAVVVKMNTGILYVYCQGSNDRENWTSFLGVFLPITVQGYEASAVVSDFGFAYARLRYVFASATDGHYCVFGAGLKTFAK